MGSQDSEYEQFVRARTSALLRCAYLLTGDQHLAEDLVQEALARTHLSWRDLHAVGNAEAYTRKIMYRLQISVWRRRRFKETYQDGMPEPRASGDLANDISMRLSMRRALGLLSARQRAVIVLRYFDDLTEVQTADALGISVGTVKSQSRDALARLRVLVPDLDADVIRSERDGARNV
jgi:RNA polymerase sigma-70 factor (sigma-E family)